MNTPFFSIVTVTLNCADDACRTAASVATQDFRDFEYLVKDGESSDGTVARLKGMGVPNIHVSKDGGIYPAMNQALRLCTGRYVWYLNAGDTLASPTVLSQFAEHITAHGFPAFVYSDHRSMSKHPVWKPSEADGARQVRARGRLTRFYLYRRTICHQAWAVERTLYERCGGLDEGLRMVADYDFLLKAVLRLGVSYSRVPCLSISYAAGGDSESNLELARVGRETVLRRYFSPWERFVYQKLSEAARFAVHGRLFRRLHRNLPAGLQARLAGL